MLFGFLFKSTSLTYIQAFTYIGYTVIVVSLIILITRFRKEKVVQEVTPAVVAGSVV
jgi:NNP family nitrate/nitrite transporter-like MFS transporter